MDRNRQLVPDSWSLVRERALTTGLCSEGWYSEHSGVCRRAELQITVENATFAPATAQFWGQLRKTVPLLVVRTLSGTLAP